MAKIVIQDLAKGVAKKHKLGQKDVERFMSLFFQVVNDGLDSDKQVKIKGLGTFKVTAVKQRESVNVNTGSRVVIEGHEKVSFTPDTAMKEQVNKPFAQFETVPLNDDVDFADTEKIVSEVEKDEDETGTIVNEAPKTAEKTVVETPKVSESVEERVLKGSTPVVETFSAPNTSEAEIAETAINKEKKERIDIAENVAKVSTEPISPIVEHPSTNRPSWLVLALVALSCLALGYFLGRISQPSIQQSKQEQVEVADSQATDTLTTPEIAVPNTNSDELDLSKINSDPRVKYGAYIITGIESTVTLQKGQTLKSYSRATLGPGMECYFQALNDTSDLSEGDVLKVPKVKVKKRK